MKIMRLSGEGLNIFLIGHTCYYYNIIIIVIVVIIVLILSLSPLSPSFFLSQLVKADGRPPRAWFCLRFLPITVAQEVEQLSTDVSLGT